MVWWRPRCIAFFPFGHASIVLLLIVHLLIGYRRHHLWECLDSR
ncbi:MAG: hypothetical protein ACRETP_10810 [Steroidobacteraceae bacterium]